MPSIAIDSRFCGPKTSGNGGYSAGLIAKDFEAKIDSAVKVTLRSPPPLGEPIEIRPNEKGIEAVHGDQLVATAKASSVTIELPPLPSESEVEAARVHYEARADHHLLPHCFVCGVGRHPGDGLRIFAGQVQDRPLHADYWTPTEDLIDDDGLVGTEFLWAALDCPGYFALRPEGQLCLLGQFAVDIHRHPKASEKLLCMAWSKGHDGRKFFADSAIVDENGGLVAAANAVWIRIDDPQMLERMRRENS